MKILRVLFIGICGILSILLVAWIAVWIALSLRPAGKTIRETAVITIPTPFKLSLSFIDYLSIDGPRLYAGYSTHGVVGIADTARNRTVATIGGLGLVHGVAIDPEKGLGFATDSGDNTVVVFDMKTNRVVAKIPVDDDPDAIIFDPKFKLIYVANHDGASGDLIDPSTLKVVARIALGGHAEYAQADPNTGLIYQNLEDTSEVVVVDPARSNVAARFKLPAGGQPTGLALDSADHRLFVTGLNSRAFVVNAETGAVIVTLPIGAASDGVGYDPALRRIYTANALSSTITVIQQDTPDRYRVLENAPTHFGGHSLAVDPASHRIYLAYFGRIAAYDVRQPVEQIQSR
jgi:YVTN family beta-propeller protein